MKLAWFSGNSVITPTNRIFFLETKDNLKKLFHHCKCIFYDFISYKSSTDAARSPSQLYCLLASTIMPLKYQRKIISENFTNVINHTYVFCQLEQKSLHSPSREEKENFSNVNFLRRKKRRKTFCRSCSHEINLIFQVPWFRFVIRVRKENCENIYT